MKRTKFPQSKSKVQLKDLGIARQLAWSFNSTTGIEYDELYAEAMLAYAEAINTYEPESKTKFSTWAYIRIKSALINFAHQEKMPVQVELNQVNQSTKVGYYWELEDQFSKDAKIIANMIITNPHQYIGKPPKYIRGQLKKELREKGWTWPRIYSAFRDMKQVLYENN